jgi:hypothetical protein
MAGLAGQADENQKDRFTERFRHGSVRSFRNMSHAYIFAASGPGVNFVKEENVSLATI